MADLSKGVDALIKFRGEVDKALADLESSAGGKAKVAAERVSRGSFGTGMPFAEADGFFTEYARVHQALVGLSKSLGDQIELLTIGVHAADVGYNNIDEEKRRRFHEIQARLDIERDEAEARQKAKQELEQPPKPVHGATSGKKDLG
ncbi:hypothetical protein [Streptomyces sp. NPDC005805]|uniref:hypothetical protein n=1 Tax=Streptomyces sp. NPDC005805 TaxID=3157068 RepID=UPI0033F3EC08